MFPNQIPGFVPAIGAPTFHPGVMPAAGEAASAAARFMPPAQLSDIYQAAKQRAVEEHEVDKLFNAEFYGDAI